MGSSQLPVDRIKIPRLTGEGSLMWNVETSHLDAKRKTQGQKPRVKVSIPSTGTDWLVVALKPGKPDGAKGPTYSLFYNSINQHGRN